MNYLTELSRFEEILSVLTKIEKLIENCELEKFMSEYDLYDSVLIEMEKLNPLLQTIPVELLLEYPAEYWNEFSFINREEEHEYFDIDREIIWVQTRYSTTPFIKLVEQIIQDIKNGVI